MTRKPTLAVLGATGAVGAVMLQILSQHADIWGDIRLLASPRSAGRKLAVRGEETEVVALSEDALEGVDVALFLVPAEVSERWAPVAAAKGAVVVDNSAAFRMDPDVPLVVPEVNPHAVRTRPRGIVASPHDTTLAMLPAVGALHAEFGLRELVVSSYQAVSGAGRDAVGALRSQLSMVAGTELGTGPGDVRRAVGDELEPFAAPIALNVVPWSGTLEDGGWSSEELGLRAETRKILDLPGLRVAATFVRVPVITTHSLAVHARFESEVTVERAHEILATSPGVVLYDDPAAGDFPTPADVVGTDPTWVGRVRRAPDDVCALELFVCGDNLRKGAALNSAQIAEAVAAEIGPRLAAGSDTGSGSRSDAGSGDGTGSGSRSA
ncbi:aspartate-semialdehyde dehydrogenase [Streptomyces sp. NBC_01750]|uniref:aspartate-semialdehyde dehydrogenase n=1 Tax=Streptomyces sp. NBC_01750 TaxID=2975928 RepID=UPI002DD95917|nr:aspartate-semialdehyde dehydrogenase [Streptomyces sp. NBC_01750]WSD34365.1 aspartate-semialdehyde dehydrogenase [Streptomyces sp. NBC_01750]